ncbi:hypothetical protein BT63DRAFT_429246, partial [Microthyrium microscopicum]
MARTPAKTMGLQTTSALAALESQTNALLTSITKYTPSIPAIHSLMDAEDTFIACLATLREHQDNYARLLQLRALADSLDNQVKESVRTIADLRSQLVDLEWTEVSTKGREVGVAELLRFAKNISRFTVPHTMPDERKVEEPVPEDAPATEAAAIPDVLEPAQTDTSEGATKKDDFAWSNLPSAEQEMLQANQRALFLPFPNADEIQASALSAITKQVNEGLLPADLGLIPKVAPVEELTIQTEQRPETAMEDIAPLSAIPRERAQVVGSMERPKKTAFQGFGLDDEDD